MVELRINKPVQSELRPDKVSTRITGAAELRLGDVDDIKKGNPVAVGSTGY